MANNDIRIPNYIELKEFYHNNRGEVYKFQNLKMAGNYEYRVFTGKIEPFKLSQQNKMASALVKIILEVVCNGVDYEVIGKYLAKNRVIHYYESFRETLSAVIENNDEVKGMLEGLVDTIIFCSSNSEMIKMALIMAQVLEISNLKIILNIFSIHNDFMFYVINDYSHIKGHNQKIFEIAKRSEAYGKLFALAYLKNSTTEIEDWLIQKGCIDDYGIPEIAECSFFSVDLLEYLNRTKFNSSSIEVFGKYFSEALSNYGLDEFDDDISTCNKVLEIIDEINGGIYSLYTVVSIMYAVDGILTDYYQGNRNIQTLQNCYQYKNIIKLCTNICNKAYWNDIIDKEIYNTQLKPNILMMCMEKTGYKLRKKEYEDILKRNSFRPIVYEYGLCIGNKSLKKAAFKFAIENLPIDDMTMGPEEIRIKNLSYEDMSYVCFFVLVKHSELEDFKDQIYEYKNISLRGLQCSLIEVREESIANLNKIKELINDDDRKLIYKCIENECVPNIRRNLKELVEKKSNLNKNKQIIAKPQKIIAINSRDTFLCNVNILGEDEFDRIKIKKSLKEKMIIYIDKNPIAENDFSVVACIENGYVVGYIEKPIDSILNNLIQAKRYVYGIIKQVSDNYNNINVSLYLSYKDIEEGVSDILSLLSKSDEQYIQ